MPAGRLARLFVAVWPPEEIVERLAGLDRPDVVGLRWTDRRQWHVTLRFLGRADAGETRRALEGLAVSGAPVEAVVGPRVERFGAQVLHVPVSGLDGVAAAAVAATGEVGEPPEDRRFAGHVTLARVAKRAHVDLRGLVGQEITGTWPVSEVSLVRSRPSSSGATYEVVERFALTG